MSTAASGRTRARDLDRATASSLLDAAYAEGQLGADEYHDRIAQAAAAKTLGELAALTADLQTPAAARGFTAQRSSATRKILRRSASGGSYPDHTRARDADRATTRDLLDSARADGQLSEEEHDTLTELAAEARTLGDLKDLVSDLQRSRDTAPAPRPPRSRRRQWYVGAVTVAAVLAACAGYLAVAREAEPRPAAQALPVLDQGAVQPLVIPTPSPHTTEGIATFLRNYQRKFGDLQVDELYMHEDYATLVRAVPGQQNRKVAYDYRGGFAQSGKIETRKADTPSVDLGTLNADAIGRALADAATITRVPGGAVSHFMVSAKGDRGSVEPTITVHVNNPVRENGYFTLTPAGEIRLVRPFEG
ncbi:DUF1707 SHOCT-like domain-containing protein [Nocardia arthritidis]|uniref:DUF1707 SHOCT-like domain-containing protein n=1 Tax=Nocardia arthritidis TaxID=228602 RepID=UPI0007A43879|nr:DUF1707 domain-containing protein [Nocardia arthritidis]